MIPLIFNRSRCYNACALLMTTVALTGTTLTGVSWAQPDLDNGAKADNPANRAPGAQRRGQGNFRLAPQNDPQSRMRRQFVQMGITDTAQQDALMAYIDGETTAREALVAKGRDLGLKLRVATLTDVQALSLLNSYNATLDDDRARRETAIAKLKKTVDFSRNPKIETYLTLLGFYGDGPAVLNSGNTRQRQTFTFRGGGAFAVPAPGAGVTTPQTVPATPATAARGTVAAKG